jgi:DNA-binding transcriptional MerR regulator
MRIGEVAERAGVNVETLRYYERRGLLPEPVRSVGGHRDYGEESVRFVRAIKDAQSLGFSLGEIEDYLRLTQRRPGHASPELRSRLAGKLDEVDEKLEALRRMRSGLERALEVDVDAVEQSKSPAGYLVRRGREPQLGPGEPLHVTNGESAARTLRAMSPGGVVLSWDDVLHEGPLADVPPAELRPLRARFLAECGWGDEDAIEAELERRDEILERAQRGGHPIVLWFEHDLYDQLQLLQILSVLGEPAPGQIELVQANDYLGSLDADELARIGETRLAVDTQVVALACDAWRAVCTNELDTYLERDTSALPHLDAALRRLREERTPLARTKRQLLEALRDGPKRPPGLFAANQAAEEAIFLGDAWCFLHLFELSRDGFIAPELPLPPPRGEYDAFAAVSVELTPAGRGLIGHGP